MGYFPSQTVSFLRRESRTKANFFIRWQIFLLEISRLWDYYIGLPVSPRAWSVQRPNLDEL